MPAINAEVKVYAGHELTAQDFAILMEYLTPETDGRLRGCSITASGTYISITSGWCILHGRLIRVRATENIVQVTKPSSGTKTLYAVLSLNRDTGVVSITARANVPEDTPSFNTTSEDDPMAYACIATLTVGTSGITKVVQTPLMRQHDNLIYRYVASKKNIAGSKSTEYKLRLMRNGYVVTCSFIYTGIIPTKNINNSEYSLGKIIPEGYRPDEGLMGALKAPYIQNVSHNVNGGRGQWKFYPDGTISGETNTAAFIQRHCAISWITNDDYPGKVYEDLDES